MFSFWEVLLREEVCSPCSSFLLNRMWTKGLGLEKLSWIIRTTTRGLLCNLEKGPPSHKTWGPGDPSVWIKKRPSLPQANSASGLGCLWLWAYFNPCYFRLLAMCRKWPAEPHVAALLRTEVTQDRATRQKVPRTLSPWSATPLSPSPYLDFYLREKLPPRLSHCRFRFSQSYHRRLICNIMEALDFTLGYFDSSFLFSPVDHIAFI